MKQIIFILMCLCSLTANAQGLKSSYVGELKITVSSEVSTIPGQVVDVVDNGATVTMTIPDFSFAGMTGDVTIVADRAAATGKLDNPQISFTPVPFVFGSFKTSPDSFVLDSGCEIHLSLFAGLTVEVDFVGQ